MRRFSFARRALAGLAVLPDKIHLVQLERTKNTYSLQRVITRPIPADMCAGGCVKEFEAFKHLLTQLVQAEGLQAVQTAVSVPVNQVKLQRLQVPAALSDADVAEEVAMEAQHKSIDYCVRPSAKSYENTIIMTAAVNDYHARYVTSLQAAGLQPVIVDIDIFAMLRCVKYSLRNMTDDKAKIAVIYLGDSYCVMAAEQQGDILFHQAWDNSTDKISLPAWLEWCAQAYRQAHVTVAALSGKPELINRAVKILTPYWSCQFYEIDPFADFQKRDSLPQENRSGYLLACGLALREPLPWMK